MLNLDPKALRAQARQLLELARQIEATQQLSKNPAGYVQKVAKQKVAGMKRKVRYRMGKTLKI